VDRPETPEWEIFSRIEELEALKPTAEDAHILAVTSIGLAFAASASQDPARARIIKDEVVGILKMLGLSSGLLEWLERALLGICDLVEERQG
jgi:hypothetical protein